MEQEEHFVGKVAQKAIIHRDGKVFLTRDPRTPDTWELPGGRLNIDESPKDGLKRELFEELGIECQIEQVLYVKQFLHVIEGNKRSLVLVYTASMDTDSPISVEAREVAEYGWFSQEEVAKMKLFPEYQEALDIFFSK